MIRRGFMAALLGVVAAAGSVFGRKEGRERYLHVEGAGAERVGVVWWVYPESPESRDADGYGLSPDKPFHSFGYARDKCVAGRYDMVVVCQGRNQIPVAVI